MGGGSLSKFWRRLLFFCQNSRSERLPAFAAILCSIGLTALPAASLLRSREVSPACRHTANLSAFAYLKLLLCFFLLLVSQNVIKRRNNENQENQHNKYGADSDDGVHAGLADQNAL